MKDDINNNNELDDMGDIEMKKEEKDGIEKRTNGSLETAGLLGENFVDDSLYAEGLSPEELARNLTTIKKEVEMVDQSNR